MPVIRRRQGPDAGGLGRGRPADDRGRRDRRGRSRRRPPQRGDERCGIGLPAIGNLHCHAFQRGMAGLAERRGERHDNFWTWRDADVPLRARGDPGRRRGGRGAGLCRDAGGGLHAVGEFHYLHHDAGRRALRQPRRNGGAHRRRRGRDRHRPDAAAGLLRARQLRRRARRPSSAASSTTSTASPRCSQTAARFATPRGGRRRRAAQAARRDPGGTRGRGRARRRRADPHPCRRADQRGRGLPRLVRRAAGRWLLDHAEVDRALVPDPRHPHDEARCWRSRGRARSPASARSPRPTSATASFRRAAFLAAGGASASARIPTS